MELQDRGSEREVLDRLLEAVRGGESRALVVCGEPGVGKSALLEYVVGRASGFRIARTAGVQSEMELAFAGLEQLCAPLLDRLERLPAPQRNALCVAFGLSAGETPDRFLVGLAALGLLSEAADEQPLLCVVDDSQWLDRASARALAFVARRLQAESVALVLAVREPGEELSGLPELSVYGLGDADARALLGSVLPGPLDKRVLDRIVEETRGNPLALLELPRGLPPDKLAGGFGLAAPQALSARIEESFQRRLAPLPAKTQQLLLLAAAEPLGDPVLLWRAGDRLGIDSEAAEAAEAEGLLQLGARVIFRHPLARSAVYRAASPHQRREVHRALGEATDPAVDPDRRAWHRAQAASGPDEAVAAELARSADRARARGGLAAAAAFLERAAALTPDSTQRSVRALAAAEAKMKAGAPDSALGLLASAETAPLDELQRARAERLRAQIAFEQSRGNDAPLLLLSAAMRLEPLEPTLARETYLDAIRAALQVGDGATRLEVAKAVRAAAPAEPPRAAELLLTGWGRLLSDGFPAGTDLLRRALIAFRNEPLRGEGEMHGLWYAAGIARSLWDDENWGLLSARHVQLAREAGALSVLSSALETRAEFETNVGELSSAAALLEEADAISQATGSANSDYESSMLLAAWRDAEGSATERIEAALRETTHKSYREAMSGTEYASAVLQNSLGRYEVALAAAQRSQDHHVLKGSGQLLSELVEAAVRSDEPEQAAAAFEQLSERTRLGGTDWGLGVEARSRALLSEGQSAEDLYREAIARLGRTRIRTALARAHLIYGEWLRRERRRTDAREQLRTAHEMFVRMGAEGFAERARRELRATGETARKRVVETSSRLTARETQVARLARDGLSNPEIGARLFISANTVDYHLRKVFRKLGINSRMQLARVFPSESNMI
ncbi:MAG TPA: AAA family ATPase [Gaiellaceae bacterium]|jgi:DNA-binding CsgD family transcriptional regulator